jgi:hypothetical protein
MVAGWMVVGLYDIEMSYDFGLNCQIQLQTMVIVENVRPKRSTITLGIMVWYENVKVRARAE